MDDKVEKNVLKMNGDTHDKDIVMEVYRKITLPDAGSNGKSIENLKNDTSDNKMAKEEVNAINDGADEQMLGTEDNGKLTEKRDEVKFIKGDHQNSDAKIDIGVVNGKTFTGMTKEELMKYANDPFWVRLRWIFFILFWGVWLAMLVCSVLIIIKAPKCTAPEPLPWYKSGPLALFASVDKFNEADVAAVKHMHASGAIYELPPEQTYDVLPGSPVEAKIKNLISQYKKADVNVILDITPNYVSQESPMFKAALNDTNKRSPFIWVNQHQVPNQWVALQKGSAWNEVQPGNFVLSQFGTGLFDLNMNNTQVKKEFEATLRHLVKLGIKGIRLKNTKFYLLTINLQEESIDRNNKDYSLGDYGFTTHNQTTFQDGLPKLLEEYKLIVKNTSTDAFLSVADDLLRPYKYQSFNNTLSVELPLYGQFMQHLGRNDISKLDQEMKHITNDVGNNSWMQWNCKELINIDNTEVDASALALFITLLPGVPVMPMDNSFFKNVSADTFKHMNKLRHSPSYMHGDFNMYDANDLVAYSRIKSGNPGYFVVYNPTETLKIGNFTGNPLPDKMTVDAVSSNYNVTDIFVNSKLTIDTIAVSPHATIILTYVPLKSG